MNTTFTKDEIEFDVVIEGTNLVCQSPTFDVIIPDAYSDLKAQIIKEIKHDYWDGNGISIDYDNERLTELVNESFVDYARHNFEFGNKLVH